MNDRNSYIRYLFEDEDGNRLLTAFINGRAKNYSNKMLKTIKNNLKAGDINIYRRLRKIPKYSKKKGVFKDEEWSGRASNRASELLDQIPDDLEINTIMDIGSSEGTITGEFGKLLGLSRDNIIAVDIQKPKHGHISKDITFVMIKPGDSLPAEDESIDIVTASMSFHHIDTIDQTLDEIYRVLRPGGVLIMREHDARKIDPIFKIYLEVVHGLYATVLSTPLEMSPEDFVNDHYSNYRSKYEWISLLREHGFRPVRKPWNSGQIKGRMRGFLMTFEKF